EWKEVVLGCPADAGGPGEAYLGERPPHRVQAAEPNPSVECGRRPASAALIDSNVAAHPKTAERVEGEPQPAVAAPSRRARVGPPRPEPGRRSAEGRAPAMSPLPAFEIVGQGPEVVLIPGTFSDRRTWLKIVAALARSFSCLLYDPRGTGDTPDPGTPFSPDELVDDLLAVMDAAGV